MSADVGLLVITAPLSWWPPLQKLHLYPLNNYRTFFSAITNAGVALNSKERIVSLSRLGRSVMMSATLITSSCCYVQVYNPFSGEEMKLNVSHSHSQHTLDAEISLHELVKADRIRIEAAVISLQNCNCENNINLTGNEGENKDEKNDSDNELGGRYVADAKNYILRNNKKQMAGISSILFSGDHGVGKTYTMHRVAREVELKVNKNHNLAVDCRNVSIARLLQLNEREALQFLRVTFAIPPVDISQETLEVIMMIIITLDGVDLLQGPANPLVALIIHQLCVILDEVQETALGFGCHIVLLTTAESCTLIPAALLSRLTSKHIHITHPSRDERLRYIESKSKESDEFQLRVRERVADLLAGCTAGQLAVMNSEEILHLLQREAAIDTVHREKENKKDEMNNTSDNNNNITIENLYPEYSGLIGLSDVIRDLEELVVWPLQNLRILNSCNVSPPRGVVLCGQSGSGKTALLTALAKRLRSDTVRSLHVMLIDGLTLVEKEVGRTEKNIESLFASARATAPTALFLDNIDSLAPPRGKQTSEVSNTADRTLSTLLTAMDGVSSSSRNINELVFVVASTPSIAALDPAISRPGRLDVHLTLTLPTAEKLRSHVMSRLISCLNEYKRIGNGDNDETIMKTKNNIINTTTANTADVDTSSNFEIIKKHVERCIRAGRVSAAEANAFVRELLLKVVEGPSDTAMERLIEALANAKPL